VIYDTQQANCVQSLYLMTHSVSVYTELNSEVITKLWRGKDLEGGNVSECRFNPGFNLQAQRTTNPNQDSTSAGRDEPCEIAQVFALNHAAASNTLYLQVCRRITFYLLC
jgi:hypothetical protein